MKELETMESLKNAELAEDMFGELVTFEEEQAQETKKPSKKEKDKQEEIADVKDDKSFKVELPAEDKSIDFDTDPEIDKAIAETQEALDALNIEEIDPTDADIIDEELLTELEEQPTEPAEATTADISEDDDEALALEMTATTDLAVIEHDTASYLPAITEEDEITASGSWKKRVVVIAGASGGIGGATAHQFSIYADVVYNLDIEMQEDNNINFIKTDVTSYDEVKSAIDKIFEKEGQIDVLVNMAGIGMSGTAEATNPTDMHKVMSTNFLGTANVCACVVPYMRAQQRGRIINISSLSSVFALPFQAFYSASKAAVTNYTNALRSEVAPFGIKVAAALFSEVNSGFSDNRIKNRQDDKAYKYNLAKSVAKFEFAEQYGKDPQDIAKKLFKLSNKKEPKPVVVFGLRDKAWCFISRFLTNKAINRLVLKRY